ncbi:MAG: exported protein of unknown function [Candidatus Saccharibacteria bacterium]|nr:exported protein of unknown function [Candidatus Saccharibacteria bacterium]
MLNSRRLITLGLLATVVASVVFLTRVSADDSSMTDAQIVRIKASCTSAKTSLNQLRVSDALLRVNRGQMYDSMTSKLMSPFNSRVDSNNLNSKDLVSITNNYNTAFTTFSNDYQAYAEQLSSALNIDCQKEPVAFYDAVASSRTKRGQVHSDVVILHQYIDDYATAFGTFVSDNQQTIGVGK